MVLPEKDRRVGRPGMEPVTVLVLGVVKRGSRTSLRPDPGAGERARVPPQQRSIFEPHTRWILKGKAGVPVRVLEDRHCRLACITR